MRNILFALCLFSCNKPNTDINTATDIKPKSQPTKNQERLAQNKIEGYEIEFPPGWEFYFEKEEADIFGQKQSFELLKATWGAPVKAKLSIQTRDHFIDGDDLVRRDLPVWMEAVTKEQQILGEPNIKPVQGKTKGMRVTLNVMAGSEATYLERVYLYAPGLSKAYVMTFSAKMTEEASFSEQRALIVAAFEVKPPADEPLDDAQCKKAMSLLRDGGRPAKEIACLRAMGVPAQNPEPWWLSLGAAYSRAGLEAEALDAYQSALSSSDKEALYRARLSRGRLLRESERYADAAAEYRAALDQKPDSKDATFGLGLSLHLGGDPKGAIALYQSWISAHPNDHEMKESLALALEDIGGFKDAAKLWQEALAVRKKNPSEGDNPLWIEKGEKALTRLKEKAERRGP
jgi:tetratricopeptide (TPR) repeat protein